MSKATRWLPEPDEYNQPFSMAPALANCACSAAAIAVGGCIR